MCHTPDNLTPIKSKDKKIINKGEEQSNLFLQPARTYRSEPANYCYPQAFTLDEVVFGWVVFILAEIFFPLTCDAAGT